MLAHRINKLITLKMVEKEVVTWHIYPIFSRVPGGARENPIFSAGHIGK